MLSSYGMAIMHRNQKRTRPLCTPDQHDVNSVLIPYSRADGYRV